jgi:hypothetical protein
MKRKGAFVPLMILCLWSSLCLVLERETSLVGKEISCLCENFRSRVEVRAESIAASASVGSICLYENELASAENFRLSRQEDWQLTTSDNMAAIEGR